jgi:hypothetical protein
MSHIRTKKCKKAIETDRVEDSEDLDSYDLSSDGGLNIVGIFDSLLCSFTLCILLGPRTMIFPEA